MSSDIIKELVEKTMRELSTPPSVVQRSRVWTHPQGYRYLVQWSNAVLLRFLIRLLTASLPKSEYRRKAQLDDAGRSTVRNLEEGYKRSNTSAYIEFISFSQGSLEEVKGDIRELTEDGFLPSKPGSSLAGISINLGAFNKALAPLKSSNNPLKEIKGELRENIKPWQKKKSPESDQLFLYHPLTVLYPPLSKVQAEDLTYEIFLELINKTDYLLRVLVQSLEKKLRENQKGYQIEQAKIKDKFRK